MPDILSLWKMPVTADKCYNNAAIEPNNPCHVIDERSSHDVGNLPLDRYWWLLSDDVEILSYSNTIPWATLFWLFFHKHLFRANEIYLLAGDEVVISKSGKQTYGLDRFFSRPKVSKNKNKTQVVLTSELLKIQEMIKSLFKLLAKFIPLTYLVLDGHFGNNNALQMARQVNLHIISKLRYDSALYIPYQHPEPILLAQIFVKLTALGCIHPVSIGIEPS